MLCYLWPWLGPLQTTLRQCNKLYTSGFVDDIMIYIAYVLYTARLTAEGCQSLGGNAQRGGASALQLRHSLSPAEWNPLDVRPMSHPRLWRTSKSHRIEQRSMPKTSRATVRRAMSRRATRPVPLATLTRHPLSRVKVARLCRRCDIILSLAVSSLAVEAKCIL